MDKELCEELGKAIYNVMKERYSNSIVVDEFINFNWQESLGRCEIDLHNTDNIYVDINNSDVNDIYVAHSNVNELWLNEAKIKTLRVDDSEIEFKKSYVNGKPKKLGL